MELHQCILKRRSIRKYLDKEVEQDKINQILESAMAAPSAKNCCNWEYIVITNKELMEKIYEISPAYKYYPSVMIVVCYDFNKTLSASRNDFAVQDCSAAIENMLLEATNLNLGSVWCGIYPRNERVEAFQTLLELNEDTIPLGLVEIGYPDEIKESRSQFDESKVRYIK